MTWLWARAVRRAASAHALAVSLVAVAGCTTSSSTSAPTTNPAPVASLEFDVDGVLTLSPGEERDVTIRTPPGHAAVSVWLEGDYLDGSLDAADLTVQDDRATVRVHAPTRPSTFALRAKAEGLEDARLDVSVSASGFGALRVGAGYGGHRAAPELVGSVFLQSTCDDLDAAPLHDGAPRVTAAPGAPLVLSKVPAGARLAVSVRIGHYASGCIDVDPLLPDATRDVNLTILDRPMALDATSLESKLTFEPTPADRVAWDAMLVNAANEARDAFVAPNADEAGVLLDAMASATPTSASDAFQATRSQESYATKTTTWLTSHTPSLRERAKAYLDDARTSAFGDLTLHVDPSGQVGLATITLERFAALPAGDAGLSTPVAFGWTADPDDTAHLSGSVDIAPTRLATRAADARAMSTVAGSTGVADALAADVDCDGLGAALVGSGESYPGCDAACTAALCRTALATMWDRAATASSDAMEVTEIGLVASAHADVGDHAEPVAFQGTWVGQVTGAGASFGLKGSASGAYGPKVP